MSEQELQDAFTRAHEAGHTLMAILKEKELPVFFYSASVQKQGEKLGVSQTPLKEKNLPTNVSAGMDALALLIMAGEAAEHLLFEKARNGASNHDIKKLKGILSANSDLNDAQQSETVHSFTLAAKNILATHKEALQAIAVSFKDTEILSRADVINILSDIGVENLPPKDPSIYLGPTGAD